MTKPEHTPDETLDLKSVIIKYYDAVRSNALHATRSENAAADVTQSVFTLLVERWDSLDHSRIGGWIFAALRRKLLEYFRKAAKDGAVLSLDDAEDADEQLSSEDVYFDLSDSEIDAVKERVLSVLSEEERKIYDAYFTEGRSYEDICAVYSLSYSAASSRVMRIRRKLEKSIKENGGDLLPMLAAAASLPVVYYVIFNGRFGR